MPVALTVLDRVTWHGTPLAGERSALLLAALAERPGGLSDARLVDEVWGEDPPTHPTKALQVLVSRVRAATAPEVVVRTANGYRLGLAADDVDALLLPRLAQDAMTALAGGDAGRAADLAGRVVAVEVADDDTDSDTAPARMRRAARDMRERARRSLALALVADGRADDALPLLENLAASGPGDPTVVAALLRAVSHVHGPSAALDRYARHRADLADRLGVDPDPVVQAVYRELLAADAPVRHGIRHDLDPLLGRDADLDRLRAALRRSRLVSVVGPGGIGKTRVAHVLAAEAPQPRVHVVELVAVRDGEEVLSAVGGALGVRGSVTGSGAMTRSRLLDIRGRVTAELTAAPTLLVIDNCEHVVDAVAELVGGLLATTRDLRVLTTSRAPLGLAAEQAVALSQLDRDDAGALFGTRARAARADVVLDPGAVAEVVDRLDGLPLALELAAARLRTMTVEEVRRGLEDRFALLRSRGRLAPVRHRTLEAVIEWSWDLLEPPAREALARLAVLPDGVTRRTAEVLLGASGSDLLDTLAEQSLLVVSETGGATRFRMLETVREFGLARLEALGLADDARERVDGWAAELVARHAPDLLGPHEFAAVDALRAEDANLTDVVHRALRRGDPAVVTEVLSGLATTWGITGDNARLFAVADAVEQVLAGW
ncbi:MAG: ATP-binding protein, partial [Dermatophilaceae bacterium]